MKGSILGCITLLALFFLIPDATAQEGSCVDATGGSSTLILPLLEGDAKGLRSGDTIRVYTVDGLCVGETTWSGEQPAVLTMWRDDPVTQKSDGAIQGDILHLVATSSTRSAPMDLNVNVRAVTDASGAEHPLCCAYQPNALWVADPDAPHGAIGEAGAVTVRQGGTEEWMTVPFSRPLIDPVVVVGPPSYNGREPVTVRVRNVGREGFEVQLDEWDYLDGEHTAETVPWMAIEAGEHTLADGRRIEAGRRRDVGRPWLSQMFSTAFEAAPVVLVQVASAHGPSAVAPRVRAVTNSGFNLSIQPEEAATRSPEPETVSWVAVDVGGRPEQAMSGTAGVAYGVGRTGDVVTESSVAISFETPFGEQPSVMAAMQTYGGSDPASLRSLTATGEGWSVFVEEERSSDSEIGHTTEIVGWLALAPGVVLGSKGGTPSATTAAGSALTEPPAVTSSVIASPSDVVLEGVYPNPSRGPARVRYGLPSEASVTVEVFDALGRRVSVLTDGQQAAGWHEANAGRISPGLYIVRLRAGSVALTRSFTVVR